mgnify:CR=1 FL=1
MADTPPLPSSGSIRAKIRFHDTLNPKVWSGDEMRPEVRLRLLRGALAFYRFLGVDGLRVQDIVLTGSNAAYNYTDLSDLDVHLIVDLAATPCPDLAENLFRAKKALWSDTYHAMVRGCSVEFYVEDAAEPARSNGVYSILHGRWVRKPERTPPHPDDAAVVHKTRAYAAEIEHLLAADPSVREIDAIFSRLHDLRRVGLQKGGEFSTENLTYKALRNLGLLDKLWDARVRAIDADLSLAEAR